MALSLTSYISQIAAGQPRKPSPISNALQAIQNWAAAGLRDADIASDAAIAISKTTLGTYTAPGETVWSPIVTVAGGTAPTYTGEFQNRYTKIGKAVMCWLSWVNTVGGTAGSGGNVVEFTLPVTAANIGAASLGYSITIGSGVYNNGAAIGSVNVALTTTGKAVFYGVTGSGLLGNDQNNAIRGVRAFFIYEAAA